MRVGMSRVIAAWVGVVSGLPGMANPVRLAADPGITSRLVTFWYAKLVIFLQPYALA